MDENELCTKVSKIDPKIRFSGLINNKGRLVAGGMVGSVKSLENERDDEMLFMELALRVKMRQEFDKDFGKVNFTLSHREKNCTRKAPLLPPSRMELKLPPSYNQTPP